MSSTTKVTHRMPKGRRTLFVVALLGGSVFVTVMILESFLRLFAPQHDAQRWFESNPRYGFTLKKNFQQRYHYWQAGVAVDVQTNALGHRDKEYDLTQTEAKRVVLIGDFFTFVFHSMKQLLYTWEMKKKQHDHPDLVFDSQSSTLISEDEWRLTFERVRDFLTFNPGGVLLVQATYPTNTNTREHLKQLTNHKNLFYVDLHDAVKHLGEEKMRLPYDNHWSAEAHELSAQALFQTIRTLEVPPLQ